ncbi:MAG: LacI family DNA-binding transcriptional regulator [Acidobacteriaceae bacterium]
MNIKIVAKLAQVSTATVSRTMNGSAKVRPKTAERVRRAIESLNFHPDTNARALGSGRSNLYGLIISDITNPFFPELVKSFEDIAVRHQQEVLVSNTNYEPERMKICVRRMLQRRVDGVAIMTSEMDDQLIEGFRRLRIPMVFLDSGQPAPGVSCVRINYSAGVDAAMQHLMDLGHRRIAFLSGPMSLASARVRYQAFRESAERHHLEDSENLIQEGNHKMDGGHEAMKRILAARKRPTAVLASNDLTAIGALGAIAEAGLRVPEEISVVGFDDIQISGFFTPSLTTVALARTQIANAAFHSLFREELSRTAPPMWGEEHVIQPTLVIRESTGSAPSRKRGR